MSKFKVRYYEDAKVVEKQVEATGFYFVDDNNSGRGVVFYKDISQAHAFSDFISVEKIGE